MKALIQRVNKAWIKIDGKMTTGIGKGLLILLGIKRGDDEGKVKRLAERCLTLRIFEDDQGKMNHSLIDVGGETLIVSQFTLLADMKKGNRPSFVNAEEPEKANSLYREFIGRMKSGGVITKTGVFGAHMVVGLENDGPVTIMVEI